MAVGGVCSGMFGTVAMKVVSVVGITTETVGIGGKPRVSVVDVSVGTEEVSLPGMRMLVIQSPKEGAEREVGSVVVVLACDHVVRGGSKGPGRSSFHLQPSGMTQASIDSPGPAAVAVALVNGLPVALTALRVALMVLRGRAAADAASRASAAVLIFILSGVCLIC